MSRPTQGLECFLLVRGYHPLWPAFPDRSDSYTQATGLIRVRSSLLAESRLMSFPPGTEIFQFSGFASPSITDGDNPCGLGFPIRTFADHWVLAPPRNLSQHATSFIASWYQGIHRLPFSCLICWHSQLTHTDCSEYCNQVRKTALFRQAYLDISLSLNSAFLPNLLTERQSIGFLFCFQRASCSSP